MLTASNFRSGLSRFFNSFARRHRRTGRHQRINRIEGLEQRINLSSLSQIGGLTRISDAGGTGVSDFNATVPQVVYNAIDNDYLIVWQADDVDPQFGLVDEEMEIFGRIIDAETGQPKTNDFRISEAGGSGDAAPFAISPSVTWNSRANEYLVVWEAYDIDVFVSGAYTNIFGQRLDASGQPLGDNDFRISDVHDTNTQETGFAAEPTVTYNDVTNEYLVVWWGADVDSPGLAEGEREVFGQRLDTNGQAVGANDFRISDAAGIGSTVGIAALPDVIHNASTGDYLVTWQAVDPDHGQGNHIFGQLLNSSGDEIGSNDFAISESGNDLGFPQAAWNSATNQYLVVWHHHTDVNDTNPRIRGQRLTAGGSQTGANDFTISDNLFYSYAISPEVVYNSRNNEFLVTWYGETSSLPENSVVGQRIDSAGREVGESEFRLTNEVSGFVRPATGWSSLSNQYVVAWSGNHTTGTGLADNEREIFAQRLDVHEAFPVDLSGAVNVDAVVNGAAGALDVQQDSLDASSLVLVTDTAARSLHANGNGLPDDGFIPADEFHPDIQLAYRNDDNGLNAVSLPVPGTSVSLDVPGVVGRSVHILATSVDGAATFDVEFTDANGVVHSMPSRTIPDWQSDINDATDLYTLVDGLDRGTANGIQLDNVNDVAVFGAAYVGIPGGSEGITNIRIVRTLGSGNLVILGVVIEGPDVQRSLVVSTDDDELDGLVGPGWLSLREAIAIAGHSTASEVITFASALNGATIDLNPDHGPFVTSLGASAGGHDFELEIAGPGAHQLTIDANNETQIVQIPDDEAVRIAGLTLRQGFASSGGAVQNRGDLLLERVAVRGSTALVGGGAVWNAAGASLIVSDSELSGNSSNNIAGAVSSSGDLSITNSTLSGNSAREGGGAITILSAGQDTEITNSTLTNNRADVDGNGVPSHTGGGIRNIANSPLRVSNSIVADNYRGVVGADTPDDIHGEVAVFNGIEFLSVGNVVGVDIGLTGLTDSVLNQVGTAANPLDPLLRPLGDYGGPTRTHALRPGSPAIDGGLDDFANDANGAPLAFDQRSELFPRIVGVSVDVGATEFGAEPIAGNIVGRNTASGMWHVARSDGDSFTTDIAGFWSPAVDWQDVNTADVNGDGRDPATGVWWVGLSDGSTFTNQNWGTWASFVDWVDVHIADVNGDGNDDIVGRQASNAAWWVALSNGVDGFTNQLWGQWTVIDWLDVTMADVNGDGNADILGRQASNGNWWVGLSNGTDGFTNQLWGNWAPIAWAGVNFADVNGDGSTDIVGRQQSNGNWWVGLSNGTNGFTNQLWGGWAPIGWADVSTVDVNGDGHADLIGRQQSNGDWWVGLSDGAGSFSNQKWGHWTPVGWDDVQYTDVDGDGNTDIVGRRTSNNDLWVARSDGSNAFDNQLWGNLGSSSIWSDVNVLQDLLSV